MAVIRFSVSDCRWRHNFLARQQLAVVRIFDPENLPFFCCSGYPGIAVEADLSAPVQLALLVALGLPMHSYLPHVSFPLRLWACFSAAFATKETHSGILD